VVDDGSSDDSVDRVREWLSQSPFAARHVEKESNRGIPAALNTGIQESTGAIVTWLSDDLWDPDRLDRVVSCFAEVPEDVGVVFGDAIIIDESGFPIGELRPPMSLDAIGIPSSTMATCEPGSWVVLEPRFVSKALLHRCFIPAPTAAVRRKCYETIGFYDESLAIEDLDFWLRASLSTRFAYLRVPLVRYRRHESNFTSGASTRYLEALRDTLQKHDTSITGHRRTIARHLREEAYRVATGLLAEGRLDVALPTIRRFYLPNLEVTNRCVKETARLVGAAAHAMISSHPRPQERKK